MDNAPHRQPHPVARLISAPHLRRPFPLAVANRQLHHPLAIASSLVGAGFARNVRPSPLLPLLL
jgi:hypothetical protein